MTTTTKRVPEEPTVNATTRVPLERPKLYDTWGGSWGESWGESWFRDIIVGIREFSTDRIETTDITPNITKRI